jgi:hypothetical protein
MILVRKLDCRYFAPSDHPAPESLRSQLDEAVQRDFPVALAQAFPASFAAEDESLWMIRRLDVALDVTLDWLSPDLPNALASRTATTIVEAMFSPDAGSNVIHFANRAAYLSQFLTDVVQGDAWGKWYYGAFDGLRLLATADVVATALGRDREESLQALTHIQPGAFRRILSSLLSQHAALVWQRLMPARAIRPDTFTLARVCEHWHSGQRPALPTLEHRALWLLHAETSRRTPSDGTFSAIRAVAAFEEARLLLRPPAFRKLVDTLECGDSRDLANAAGPRLAEWLEPLLDHRDQIQDLNRPHDGITSATCFGAVFLLLPSIAAIPVPPALRFAIFRRCCPPTLHAHVTRDPLIRELFQLETGDEPEFDPVALHETFLNWVDDDRDHWLELPAPPRPDLVYLSPSDSPHDRELCLIARAILKNFAWRLPGFAKSTLGHLWTNFLDLQARVQTLEDRRIVRLSAPPLHVVLSLTGMLTSTFCVPWLDSRPFCIFPER